MMEVDFSRWLETHSHREQYFIGDDSVSKTAQNGPVKNRPEVGEAEKESY